MASPSLRLPFCLPPHSAIESIIDDGVGGGGVALLLPASQPLDQEEKIRSMRKTENKRSGYDIISICFIL